jgi:hypothetical protein
MINVSGFLQLSEPVKYILRSEFFFNQLLFIRKRLLKKARVWKPALGSALLTACLLVHIPQAPVVD